jgi:hypothetical protein
MLIFHPTNQFPTPRYRVFGCDEVAFQGKGLRYLFMGFRNEVKHLFPSQFE